MKKKYETIPIIILLSGFVKKSIEVLKFEKMNIDWPIRIIM